KAQATQLLDYSDGLLARCREVLARVNRLERGRDLPHLVEGTRPARFRYSDQHLTLDRARRPWRTQGVNRDRMLFGSISTAALMLQFRGSLATSDAGLLAYRELDDVLGLTEMAGDVLADPPSGKDGRPAFAGLFRQSVFGRPAGYEDVNDAERLRHDPAMRWIVGGKAAQRSAASPSQMGRALARGAQELRCSCRPV